MSNCEYPEVRRAFEILNLPDGSLLLNSFYGKQIHLARPPRLALDLLALCDGRTHRNESWNKLEAGHRALDVAAARVLLGKLINLGVVAESLWASRPAEVTPELFKRFETEIAALQKDEVPGHTAYDYFLRLRRAKVVIIGAGGNGSIGAMMLAAAGVASLHIIDGDEVSKSNLVRQIFYTEKEAEQKTLKVEALRRRLNELSSFTEVTVDANFIKGAADVERGIAGATCVLLCADAPRFIINAWVDQACQKMRVPYINILAGLIGPFTVPGVTPCFECLQAKYRKALGPLHDQIVAGLQKERSFQYPSFVTGVVQSTALLVKEVVTFITGSARPLTFDGVLRAAGGAHKLERFESDERCAACAEKMRAIHAQAF